MHVVRCLCFAARWGLMSGIIAVPLTAGSGASSHAQSTQPALMQQLQSGQAVQPLSAQSPSAQSPQDVSPSADTTTDQVQEAPSGSSDPAFQEGVTATPVPSLAASATLPHDLSPWGMFMAADMVVKAVMIGLVLASILTWTIWLAKALELAGARRRLRGIIARIMQVSSLAEAVAAVDGTRGTGAVLVHEAADEMRISDAALGDLGRNGLDGSGLKERVTSRLARIEVAAGRRMARGTGLLATIGATAPFVGLFGTVWGIMNSFIGISQAQTTNLAVVAPGIAEALLATALGLVAAIPAVIIYNVFARAIAGYRHLLADTSGVIERLVSRELDLRRAGPRRSALVQAAE